MRAGVCVSIAGTGNGGGLVSGLISPRSCTLSGYAHCPESRVDDSGGKAYPCLLRKARYDHEPGTDNRPDSTIPDPVCPAAVFSQLFQTLYNTADTVIIGHYLGDQSLAAVGSVAALFELIVGFSTGFGQGFGVVAGQKYGAQDSRGFRKCVALSILLSTVIAVVISAIMCLSMTGVLQLLRTPRDIFTSAYSYIFVISAGLIITIYYNLASGLLRAAGDSKHRCMY